MNKKRIIESAVGHRIALEILPGSDAIRLTRDDTAVSDPIILDPCGSKILAAFLASALVINRMSRAPEEVGDIHQTVLTMHEDPAPMVRVTQGKRFFDIHSPSWEALRCEIELVVPRLNPTSKTPDQNQSRH